MPSPACFILVVWALTAWGMTSVLTQGRIARPLRDRLEPETLAGDFVRCPQCVGWWVGLTLSLTLHLGAARLALPTLLPELGQRGLLGLCDAFATCALTALMSKIEDALKGVASLMVR